MLFGLEDSDLGVGGRNGQSCSPRVCVVSVSVRFALELLRDANIALGIAASSIEVFDPSSEGIIESLGISVSVSGIAGGCVVVSASTRQFIGRCAAPVQ